MPFGWFALWPLLTDYTKHPLL
ncbi:hypothetical protein M6B38_334740 [Iris pallida]|uniref:Uncharacterized protein n=1 Tax=Iris pallida TaxID=29817 RepID=A0AAX6H1T6_IRIPA|nr:hypothetical protein M6B38_334740 [Iris pallida]